MELVAAIYGTYHPLRGIRDPPRWGMVLTANQPKLKSAVTPREGSVPSVARGLQKSESDQLIAIAKGLPETWCVQILPPYGQLAIGPLADRQLYVRTHTASLAWRAIRRERWRPAL